MVQILEQKIINKITEQYKGVEREARIKASLRVKGNTGKPTAPVNPLDLERDEEDRMMPVCWLWCEARNHS